MMSKTQTHTIATSFIRRREEVSLSLQCFVKWMNDIGGLSSEGLEFGEEYLSVIVTTNMFTCFTVSNELDLSPII
jgi:hypothetical protein